MSDQLPPITVREIGRIASIIPNGMRVDWYDGRHETIHASKWPPMTNPLAVGEWFEAMVDRNRDGKLVRITVLDRREPVRRIEGEKLQRMVNDLPACELPPPEPLWPKRKP